MKKCKLCKQNLPKVTDKYAEAGYIKPCISCKFRDVEPEETPCRDCVHLPDNKGEE